MARWMLRAFLMVGAFSLSFGSACAPDQSLSSGGREDNLSCSPWRLTQFYSALQQRGLKKVTGCLALRRGDGALQTSIAQLTEEGELLGWNGEQFSASSTLSVAIPAGDPNEPIHFVFYAYVDQQALPKTVQTSFCEKIDVKQPLGCLSNKDQGCSFALSFAPNILGSTGQQSALLEGSVEVVQYNGGGCRLFAPPFDIPVVQKVLVGQEAVASTACESCRVGVFGNHRKDLSIQRQLVYAVAQSPDGRFLATAQGGNSEAFVLVVYEKDQITGIFTKENVSVSLDSKPFRLRFSGEGSLLAVVKEKGVEVFDTGRFFTGLATKAPYVVAVPDEFKNGVAADAVFVSPDVMAVGFFQNDSNKGLLRMYALEKDKGPRLLLEHVVEGLQTLAVAPKNDWLFVTGRVKEENKPYKPNIFGLHVKGRPQDGDFRILEQTPKVALDLPNTNITTLEISPDGRYMAGGTSPDTQTLRGPLGTGGQGKHGHLMIWRLGALELSRSFLVRPEGTGLSVHKAFTKRVKFSPNGAYLVSLGAGGPDGAADIHVWERFEQDVDPFGKSESFLYGKPAFDIDFGAGCSFLFLASAFALDNSSQPLTAWSGCE